MPHTVGNADMQTANLTCWMGKLQAADSGRMQYPDATMA